MKKITLYFLLVTSLLSACKQKNKTEHKTKQVLQEKNLDFSKTLKDDKISFKLFSKNNHSLNKLIIVISIDGMTSFEKEFEIDGTIVDAEIADLDNDRNSELYVYSNSTGSGSYGNVLAIGINNNDIEQIIFPQINDSIKIGYMGHDLFRVNGNELIQVFPIYKNEDTNAKPTGGNRIVKYKLDNNLKSLVMVSFKDEE